MATKTKTATAMSASELRSHIDTVILARARSAEAATRTLTDRLKELKGTSQTPTLSTADLTERLIGGEQYDHAKVTAALRKDTAQAVVRDAEVALCQQVLKGLREVSAHEPHHKRQEIQGLIRDQLDILVGEVAALAADHPAPVGLPDAEVDPALLPVARDQSRLISSYRALRKAQASTYTHATTGVTPLAVVVRRSGMLRDAVDNEHYWTQKRRSVAGDVSHIGRVRSAWGEKVASWFEQPPQVPFPAMRSTDGIAGDQPWDYLAWISVHAQPWVPSLDELLEQDRDWSDRFVKPRGGGGGLAGRRV